MSGTGQYGDSVYEGGDAVDDKELLDPTETLMGNDPDEIVETGYSPPDREPYNLRHAPTPAQERAGETLDDKLAEEEPDFGAESGSDEPRDDLSGQEYDSRDDEPDPRSGRLVAPNQGFGPDRDKDEVAQDVGPAGYAASAEEAAVHTVDEGE